MLYGRLDEAIYLGRRGFGGALTRSKAIAERQANHLEVQFHRGDVLYLADDPALEPQLASLVERSPTNRLWGVETVRDPIFTPLALRRHVAPHPVASSPRVGSARCGPCSRAFRYASAGSALRPSSSKPWNRATPR
jgi:hypothetical protein